MGLVFQILGVVFLLIILCVVIAALVIRAKLKSLARTIEEMTRSIAPTPPLIHLTPLAGASWSDAKQARELIDGLAECGFEKAGNFEVDEVEGLGLEAWVNPAKAITAVVYDHPKAGLWIDLYTHYEDGTRITYANTGAGAGVDHAPGHDVQRFPGLATRAMYEKLVAERPEKPAKAVSALTFATVFEKAYNDEMAWRNSRGGPTEQEIRKIAALSGETYDEDVIQATRAFAEQQALEQLDKDLRARFLAETNLSAAEWEGLRDRVVVIHDRMRQETLELAVEEWLGDQAMPRLGDGRGGGVRKGFEDFNESLTPHRRFKKLGVVSKPVGADVYEAPEE
jgi:hypothetical protein